MTEEQQSLENNPEGASGESQQPATTCAAEDDHNARVRSLIRKNVAISSGIGLVPVPLVEFGALIAQQLYMIKQIGSIYGEEKFSNDLGRKALVSLIGTSLPTGAALQLAAAGMLRAVPLVGTTLAALASPVLLGAATYAVGKVFHLHFATGGTFLSFDPERYRKQFQRELEIGMAAIKEKQELAPA